MIERRAVPGLVACALGVTCGLIALIQGAAWFIVPAVLCAVVAGVNSLGLTARLRSSREHAAQAEFTAERAKAERDHMAARAARFEAEAIEARNPVEIVMPPAALPAGFVDGPTAGPSGESDHQGAAADPDAADAPAVLDPVTGVYNERFFLATLEKRVSAARRGLRPLAVGIIDVVHRDDVNGHRQGDPQVIAACLLHTLRDADTTCRLDNGRFGIVLEDTPENGAVWTIERARRRVVGSLDDVTMWAGLACYPAHAFAAQDLLSQAQDALVAAHEWQQDRIEVASIPDD